MLREDNVVILECGSRYFRCIKGVGDPSRRSSILHLPALAVEIKQDTVNGDGDTNKTEYVCGATAESLAGQNIAQHQAIQRGYIVDWDRFAAICGHALFHELGCRRVTNQSPVLLSIPVRWSKREREQITQIFFERFNVPAFMLVEQPLMTLYGVGSVTGVAIDIGYETTNVTPIVDGFIQRYGIQTIEIGMKNIDAYFEKLLLEDQEIRSAIPNDAWTEFIEALKKSDLYSVLENPDEIDQMERSEFTFRDTKLTIGKARYAFAEPLFNPSLIDLKTASLAEAIHVAITACDAEKWSALADCLVLTGGGALMPGLKARVINEMTPYCACGDTYGDMQITSVRVVGAPDYLSDYKEHPELLGFLGALILGKVAATDAKNLVTKADYNDHGPNAIHTKAP